VLSTTILLGFRSDEGAMDKLRKYLKEIMDQRGLSVAEIERQSGGAIKDSYIFDILSGKTKHISVDKLQALALGLQMDSVELFKIASGYTPSSDPCSETLLLIKSVLTMNPRERKALLGRLKKN
jgi:transcriptional regulator with XRE-family HTH domain